MKNCAKRKCQKDFLLYMSGEKKKKKREKEDRRKLRKNWK